MVLETGFEVDFLPVGNGERSGDAICIRYGVPGQYKVLVYDGGTKESGSMLCDHIRKFYGTQRVDYVVNSHPDIDHASGLSIVLKEMEVGELWMHRPWDHSAIILDLFKDGRMTINSLSEHLKEALNAAYALESLARDKGIPMHEPFAGNRIGEFVVLSPSRTWYEGELIPQFEKSPEEEPTLSPATTSAPLRMIKTAAALPRKALKWIQERWDLETLREDVETTAENESSAILLGIGPVKGILLTGDAGIRALGRVVELAEAKGFSLPDNLKFLQVPHHGSRHNVSTSVLDAVIGPRKQNNDGIASKTAFISASKESDTHPHGAVVNALIRRGVKVLETKGGAKRHYRGMPRRAGWETATPMTFLERVEAWD